MATNNSKSVHPKFPYLRDLKQISSIQWGVTYQWDVAFDTAPEYNDLSNPPYPFDTWFPATSVKENIATISSQQFEAHLTNFSIPSRSSEQTIDLTFPDDNHHTLMSFFSEWINEKILNNGAYISPISDIVRKIYIVKYQVKTTYKTQKVTQTVNNKQVSRDVQVPVSTEVIPEINAYYVYPDTTLDFEGNSDSGIHEYSVTLKVAGTTTLSKNMKEVDLKQYEKVSSTENSQAIDKLSDRGNNITLGGNTSRPNSSGRVR